MNKMDEPVLIGTFTASATPTVDDALDTFAPKESTLRAEVERSLNRFFAQLEDEPVSNLHQMVMSEVEAPLLEAVMRYTGNNQSKASIMLGLNRGTLRTKLKH